jgi:hypothetical protein
MYRKHMTKEEARRNAELLQQAGHEVAAVGCHRGAGCGGVVCGVESGELRVAVLRDPEPE